MRFDRMKLFIGLTLLICLFSISRNISYAANRNETGAGILMQGFGWNSAVGGSPGKWFQMVGSRAKDLADMGITMIWLPPVSRSVRPQGYLPGDYYDVGLADNPTFYGNKEQLETCIANLHAVKIKVIADLVLNHRCAGQQDASGVWNVFHFPSGLANWEQWAVCRGEYGGTGESDSGEDYQAAPDIDHSNTTVQKDIIAWMNWLKKLGFNGWRYDFVRGFAPRYLALFDDKTSPDFSVGEYWTDMSYDESGLNPNQDAHRRKLCDWLEKSGSSSSAFDFTTKGILQIAVNGEYWRLRDSQGKAPGLIGWWPKRAVTFLDNHDTGSQQGHWPFPSNKTMQGYAYILTHPGIPCVFWEHVYDWNLKAQIKKIIDIRKNYAIHSESKINILKAENGLYAATVDDKIAVKLGWVDWCPEPSFKLLAFGDQYAVWGKSSGKR